MISEIHSTLLALKDDKYRDFQLKLISSKYPIIGVRLPDIKAYAKKLLKEEKRPVFKDKYYEEVLLHGLYIARYKCPFDEKIQMIEDYLPLIDNWGICDSFVCAIKDINKHKDEYYKYVKKYLKSDEEFIQRYGLVVLLDYYIEDKYIEDLYRIIKKQKYKGYYSKMAGAWLLSYLFMFYFEDTVDYVSNNRIDDFVYKKGIQKALDSYRLTDKQKKLLRTLKSS